MFLVYIGDFMFITSPASLQMVLPIVSLVAICKAIHL